jgi:TonB family protein
MTNTTTPVESIGAPSGAASFYCWEVPDKPISIYLNLDLVDRLEKEAIDTFKAVTKRGSEIGGVLAGRVVAGPKPAVVIEQFEPVECSYSRGSLYLLSDEDKTGLEQVISRIQGSGLSAVGFFRSNARSQLVMDDDDLALAKERFAGPNQVFLLVRPFAMKPSVAGFFFWENGQIDGENCYQQFPFKRAELLQSFAKFILPAPGKAAAEAPPVREPLVMPKREERPVAPPVSLKREEPAPPVAPPPKREEPPSPPPPVFRRQEPAPPPVARREEPKPPVVAPPPPPPPPPAMKREEPRPPVAPPPRQAPPMNFRREERRPIAPMKPDRPPIVTPPPKRDERPSGPALVSKREDPPVPKAPEKPALIVKREEKPVAPPPPPKVAPPDEIPIAETFQEEPMIVKVVEQPHAAPPPARPEPPAPPKVEEKPAVVVKPREPVVVVTPPKKEEPVRVQPVAAKVAEPVVERKPVEPEVEEAQPSMFARLKWVFILLPVLLIGGGAAYYFYSANSAKTAAVQKAPDTRLGLRLETNAGQLLLSWDRNAPLIASATRAVLTIADGDRKEDTELDLGQLRNGSIVYSPITNDVSFRLEVTDAKTGKVGQESVRRLAGTGKPTALGTPVVAANAKPTPAPEKPGATPAPRALATPPPAPVVTAEPAVTAKPAAQGSLASNLRAAPPVDIPEPPRIDNSASTLAPAPVSAPTIAPPPVVQRTPPPAAPAAATPRPAPAAPVVAQQQPTPAPVRQSTVVPARVIRRVAPSYPAIAVQGRIEGVVRVQVIIGKDGKVKKASALSGPQLLRRAAVDAVSRWVYSPAIVNGEPAESEQPIDVNFKL